jgi:N-acetyl-gamma-glutamyl-phosphate reductase
VIKVGVVGPTGYGGRELVRILSYHPEAEIEALVSHSIGGEDFSSSIRAFRSVADKVCEEFDAASLAKRCDAVFVAVPATESTRFVKALHDAGAKCVLDTGPDFRLKDAKVFAQFYGTEHAAPELLAQSVYGLAETNREALPGAKIVAVAGCYPIGAILAVAPLVRERGLVGAPVIVNALSGISGAGRSLNESFHFPEANENARAYKVAVHRHAPEMEQEVKRLAGRDIPIIFVPHTVPMTRGIATTAIVPLEKGMTLDGLERLYGDFYAGEPFVRVLPRGETPEVKNVRGSNFCDVAITYDPRTNRAIALSAIDNLTKGTAGQAVQDMNILFGLEETCGLWWGALSP